VPPGRRCPLAGTITAVACSRRAAFWFVILKRRELTTQDHLRKESLNLVNGP
jgi:hypothetical protein